mmetsp:Transcript_42127/g.75675  ORF Transcript_42127/g.75675 Transcript_42127/m.75675 type:complete len:358 (-) Transcript_42127:1769-2842(-)
MCISTMSRGPQPCGTTILNSKPFTSAKNTSPGWHASGIVTSTVSSSDGAVEGAISTASVPEVVPKSTGSVWISISVFPGVSKIENLGASSKVLPSAFESMLGSIARARSALSRTAPSVTEMVTSAITDPAERRTFIKLLSTPKVLARELLKALTSKVARLPSSLKCISRTLDIWGPFGSSAGVSASSLSSWAGRTASSLRSSTAGLSASSSSLCSGAVRTRLGVRFGVAVREVTGLWGMKDGTAMVMTSSGPEPGGTSTSNSMPFTSAVNTSPAWQSKGTVISTRRSLSRTGSMGCSVSAFTAASGSSKVGVAVLEAEPIRLSGASSISIKSPGFLLGGTRISYVRPFTSASKTVPG